MRRDSQRAGLGEHGATRRPADRAAGLAVPCSIAGACSSSYARPADALRMVRLRCGLTGWAGWGQMPGGSRLAVAVREPIVVWRVERTEVRAALVAEIVAAARARKKTAVVGPDGRGKTELLLDVASHLRDEALLVQVPSGLDQGESIMLQAAVAIGGNALREVDAALRDNVEIEPALAVLKRHLDGRLLVVDDIDYLAPHPLDFDLHGVIKARASAVEAWLGEHAHLCSSAAHTGRIDFQKRELEPLTAPPLYLSNGTRQDPGPLWQQVGRDPARFRLAMTLTQIEGRPPDESTGREESLLDALWAAMPEAHQKVVTLLAVHGRPLPYDILRMVPSAPSDPTIADVRSLAAISTDARSMWIDGPLLSHCRAALSHEQKITAHLSLAAAFAGELRGDEPNAWSRADALLEAHRHYAAGEEPDRALRFARYSVALLLDLARELSLRARETSRRDDYSAAAKIYADVLKLQMPRVGVQARAYAEHYLHYNRYKAKPPLIEPLSETEAGYRRSVERWPENALFWSRLALTQFLKGDRGRALETLKEARERVPDHVARSHTGKEWYLRCRTVQHLLRFDPPQVVEGLLVWNDHTATDLREQEVEREMSAALSQGFRTARLEAPGVATVYLHGEIKVEIVRRGAAFACTLVELNLSARATHPLAAFTTAIAKLRDETDRFRRALTHTLEPDARAKKRRLLGYVDIVASRLMGEVSKSTWILGQVVSCEEDVMRVREVGSGTGTFDLHPTVTPPPLPEAYPRLARVRTGTAGEPVGPVLELGEPLGRDPARLWVEWRRRLGEADPEHG